MSVKENVARAKSDYDRAYEAGKKAEYDEFWDAYQDNGRRVNYERAFYGEYWTEKTFKPKYDMHPTNASGMFLNARHSRYEGLDLVSILQEQGVTLDFSNCSNFSTTFQWGGVSRIGVVDTRSASILSATFSNVAIMHTIEKLIVHENLQYSNAFLSAKNIVNLTIEGTIGQNGFNVQWSTKLSKASIISIINALSTTTSGLTVTLSKTAVDTAFATTAGGTDGATSAEWLALVATRSNWTIALA